MDRRSALVLALGLFGGSLGCASRNGQVTPPPPPPQTDEVHKVKELPPQKPKASTCAAFAALWAKEAEEPERSAVEREAKREQARKAYQQALDLEPDYLPAQVGLARLYSSLGDHARAVATYQKAIKAHPREAGVRYELGMCHAQQREWQPAVQMFRTALEIDPENRQYTTTLGYTLARAGLYKESVECFQAVVGPAQAHYKVARMLFHVNQPALGKQYLQAAVQLDPQLGEARQMLAQVEAGGSGTVPVGFEYPQQ